METLRLILLVWCLKTVALAKIDNFQQCGTGVTTNGYTFPHGDITLEYGQNLTIYCVFVKTNTKYSEPSKYMKMDYGNQSLETEIVNSTTIRLHVEKHNVTKGSAYTCNYISPQNKTIFLCYNIVVVGTKPKEVVDTDFIGLNYENMTFYWTAPENYVDTQYYLSYRPLVRSSRTSMECPSIERSGQKYSCTWTFATKTQYRHSYEYFEFNLTAKNTFGTISINKTVDHFARIIPNPPENITAQAVGTNSILVMWTIPVHMRAFKNGLVHSVSYWTKEKGWKMLPSFYTPEQSSNTSTLIEDLPYAYYLYDIRVRMKTKNAKEERYWSQNASIAIRTKSKLPERPPRTDIGSFEVQEGGHRTIYWEPIASTEGNGHNFSYHVEAEGYPSIKPKKLSSSYAKFENLEDRNYTFKVWSKNSNGVSEKYSVVFVPAIRYALNQAKNFVKIDKGSGEYELEWSPGKDDVANYTVFWCSSLRDRPYQCDGSLHWKAIPNFLTRDTITLAKYNPDGNQKNIHQFAISVNGYQVSSGMIWAECTVIPGRGVKLRQVYVKNVSSRAMTVVWKLECFKKDDILGFNITYCPTIPQGQSPDCRDRSTKSVNVTDSQAELGVINNLTPYTRYKIQVKPILKDSEGQLSEAIFNVTFESKPSEPRNLRVVNLTNTSITIEWHKPEQENGYINDYKIRFNGEEQTVTAYKNQMVYTKTLTNLSPSTDYNITVEACTSVNCSEVSVETATELGRPAVVPKPTGSWENSIIIVHWDKPKPATAKIDHYQVWISTSNKEQQFIHSNDILQNVTGQKFNITNCQDEKYKNIYVRIRALNILDGKPLEGAWSDKADFPCYGGASSETWTVILIIGVVVVFAFLMIILIKKLWLHVLGMRNVPVKLPDGLAAVVENYQEKEKHSDEPLLSKGFPNPTRSISGETSGCSSAHESVASSIDSNGHISSDSGTEQPRSPSIGEKDGRDISLRQRVNKPNMKKATEYVTMQDLSDPAWSNKQTPGYSIIGLAPPTKKTTMEPDYLGLGDSKSSYVPFKASPISETATDPIRSPTSGYVPYMHQEPAPKNTDYVMAGTPSSTIMGPIITFPRKEDSSSAYVKAPPMDSVKPILFPRQPQISVDAPSSAYVVVGDKPQTTDLDHQTSSKGYVSHNLKFPPTKTLKED